MTGQEAAAMASQPSSTDIPSLPKLEIRSAPAVINWAGTESESIGTSLSSTPAIIDIEFDPSRKAASFRIRVTICLRGSNQTFPVYLLINAQQIKSVDTSAPRPAESDDTVSPHQFQHLMFCLERPPLLITPPEALQPKDKTQIALLQSVQLVACANKLFIAIRPDLLSQTQITALCSAAYQDFIPSSRLADLSSLYLGRGGKVTEPTTLPELLVESPPSYGDISASPPLPSASLGKCCQLYMSTLRC